MSRRRVQRSRRRASAAAGFLPDDLYDYYTAEPGERRSPPPIAEIETWRVVDDWPDRIPVSEAEIEVFERWFGDLFDELFGSPSPEKGLNKLSQSDNKIP